MIIFIGKLSFNKIELRKDSSIHKQVTLLQAVRPSVTCLPCVLYVVCALVFVMLISLQMLLIKCYTG